MTTGKLKSLEFYGTCLESSFSPNISILKVMFKLFAVTESLLIKLSAVKFLICPNNCVLKGHSSPTFQGP